MKKISCLIILNFILILNLFADYKVILKWDTFSSELTGILSGTIGNKYGFIDGEVKSSDLDGKLLISNSKNQLPGEKTYLINAKEGYFSFWIKDKFADQDFDSDMTLITKAKPIILIYKDEVFLKSITVTDEDGQGLICKVFNLDVETSEVELEKKFFPKNRLILGKVVNAVSGESLENVSIVNVKIGESLSSSNDGLFYFDIPFGEFGYHLLQFSKEGFISGEVKVFFGADENPREIIYAMSPETRNFRIVLTWGMRPKDLDAHLLGPNPEGGNFHIWYRNRYLIGGKDFLDRDDTSSYGPETVTIYKPAIGDYKFAVHNYSNRHNRFSKHLSRSGAKVQVFRENKLIKTYYVPQNQKGNLWEVFKINKKQELIDINKISFIKNEANITQ